MHGGVYRGAVHASAISLTSFEAEKLCCFAIPTPGKILGNTTTNSVRDRTSENV